MGSVQLPCRSIISLKQNRDMPNIYDVEMGGIERLKAYDSVECHLVLYPYSRAITSEDIAFYPFEEYVKDVLSQQRSAYVRIQSRFHELFGLLLGVVIALVFARFKPEDLLSVESVVSVFGAYTIGKELWDDIERMLIEITKSWKVRYQESYYPYHLEKHTTLTYYSYLAKRQRYGISSLMPEKIDFIKQSNSQTVRMCFDMQDLASLAESAGHILSIHIEPDLQEDLEEGGFLFGVKLSLNRRLLGLVRSFELFQSISRGERGCLNEEGEWIQGTVFYRKTCRCGRIKCFWAKGILPGEAIIEKWPSADESDTGMRAQMLDRRQEVGPAQHQKKG